MAVMSKKSNGVEGIAHVFRYLIPGDLKELVVFLAALLLVLFVPVVIVLGVISQRHVTQKSTGVACWQVQVVEKRVFKLNACTGELNEVTNYPSQSLSAATK